MNISTERFLGKATIALLSIVLVMEFYGFYDLYKRYKDRQQPSASPVMTVPFKVVEPEKPVKVTIEAEAVQPVKKVTQPAKRVVHYKDDRRWSKPYPKDGDRQVRFKTDKTHPRFKKKWLTWSGSEYIPTNKLHSVAKSVLRRMPHIDDSDNMAHLIVETSITESQGGYYISSKNGDYGIFQIRMITARDLLGWLKFGYPDAYEAVMKFMDEDLSLAENLEKNIPFAIAVCASEYWRKTGPNIYQYISTLEERAMLWKSVYNTKRGKGTVNAYIKRNNYYTSVLEKQQQG